LHERFPSLRGIAIRACWSGYVSLAYNALPLVGATGAHDNVLYSEGCSVHGLRSHWSANCWPIGSAAKNTQMALARLTGLRRAFFCSQSKRVS